MDGAGWHREDIKAELRKRHGPITRLSTAWGYSRGAITRVLERPLYSIPLERRVSAALGVPLHVLWPGRWHPDGTPKPRSIAVDPSPAAPSTHRKSLEAA